MAVKETQLIEIKRIIKSLIVLSLFISGSSSAQLKLALDKGRLTQTTTIPEANKSLTWHLGDHLSTLYLDWPVLVPIAAVGATWLLVENDVDAEVERWAVRQNETVAAVISVPPLIAGFFVPVAVPLLFMRSEDAFIREGGLAAGQAVGVAFAVTNLLKAITGRIPPDRTPPDDIYERSRVFNWGFLREGVVTGWPSGHTMTNMALASALSAYFHESTRIKVLSYGWTFSVMFAATYGIQGGVHWFSDVVAGGMMGWLIGNVIGKGFRKGSSSRPGKTVSVQPVYQTREKILQLSLQMSF